MMIVKERRGYECDGNQRRCTNRDIRAQKSSRISIKIERYRGAKSQKMMGGTLREDKKKGNGDIG